MNWKKFSILCFILILPVAGKWLCDSKDYGQLLMFGKEKKPVETVVVDDIFGEETTTTEWKDGFWLGLFPPTDKPSLYMLLGALPLSSILAALGILGLFINHKKKKKLKNSINKGE